MNRPASIATVLIAALVTTFLLARTAGGQDDHAGHDHGSEEELPSEPEADSHAGESEDGHDDHDVVKMTPEELAEFGVEIGTAAPGRIETYLSLPGEVRPNEDRLAHIVPRFPGIVTEVRVHVGDDVQKDQVLAILESDESLAPFEVRTMIGGTVIGKHVTLGEAISRDRDIFVIADLSAVWVDLTVYPRDLGHVDIGQNAEILSGNSAGPAAAEIVYVAPVVDETTRTATARVVLSNPDGEWRPGMFVTGRVLVDEDVVDVAVPHEALISFEGKTVVFVEDDHGLEPHPVTTGRTGDHLVEIVSGLTPGERFVLRGSFTLKAELEKESFGDGHNH